MNSCSNRALAFYDSDMRGMSSETLERRRTHCLSVQGGQIVYSPKSSFQLKCERFFLTRFFYNLFFRTNNKLEDIVQFIHLHSDGNFEIPSALKEKFSKGNRKVIDIWGKIQRLKVSSALPSVAVRSSEEFCRKGVCNFDEEIKTLITKSEMLRHASIEQKEQFHDEIEELRGEIRGSRIFSELEFLACLDCIDLLARKKDGTLMEDSLTRASIPVENLYIDPQTNSPFDANKFLQFCFTKNNMWDALLQHPCTTNPISLEELEEMWSKSNFRGKPLYDLYNELERLAEESKRLAEQAFEGLPYLIKEAIALDNRRGVNGPPVISQDELPEVLQRFDLQGNLDLQDLQGGHQAYVSKKWQELKAEIFDQFFESYSCDA